jgi:hypothetical protein
LPGFCFPAIPIPIYEYAPEFQDALVPFHGGWGHAPWWDKQGLMRLEEPSKESKFEIPRIRFDFLFLYRTSHLLSIIGGLNYSVFEV